MDKTMSLSTFSLIFVNNFAYSQIIIIFTQINLI